MDMKQAALKSEVLQTRVRPGTPPERVQEWLRECDIGMDRAINVLRSEEPEWFDFHDWLGDTPIAGWHDGVGYLYDDGSWGIITEGYDGKWKK